MRIKFLTPPRSACQATHGYKIEPNIKCRAAGEFQMFNQLGVESPQVCLQWDEISSTDKTPSHFVSPPLSCFLRLPFTQISHDIKKLTPEETNAGHVWCHQTGAGSKSANSKTLKVSPKTQRRCIIRVSAAWYCLLWWSANGIALSLKENAYPSIYLHFALITIPQISSSFLLLRTSILCFYWWFTKRWALIVVFFACQLKLYSIVTLQHFEWRCCYEGSLTTNIKNSHLAKKSRYSNRCQLVLWGNVVIFNTVSDSVMKSKHSVNRPRRCEALLTYWDTCLISADTSTVSEALTDQPAAANNFLPLSHFA